MNINDKVKVKLTNIGTARWRGLFGVTRTELVLPLWELMSVFGGTPGALHLYFVDNEIEVCNDTSN